MLLAVSVMEEVHAIVSKAVTVFSKCPCEMVFRESINILLHDPLKLVPCFLFSALFLQENQLFVE